MTDRIEKLLAGKKPRSLRIWPHPGKGKKSLKGALEPPVDPQGRLHGDLWYSDKKKKNEAVRIWNITNEEIVDIAQAIRQARMGP